MDGLILCVDSGTTSVKAAAFGLDGSLRHIAEAPNDALHRTGARVEQDMARASEQMFEVLRATVAAAGGRVEGIALTAQGDGLWPLNEDLAPVGRALTWLDGRSGSLMDEPGMSEALARIEAVTGARPTPASASLQLLWMQRHDPPRFARIRHALRLKEWLFCQLTGVLMAEPTALLNTWGDWRTGAVSTTPEEALGLIRGAALLPPLRPVAETVTPLSKAAARRAGLPAGVPVILGPGDVQSTALGLGVGLPGGVARCSIFGTSAIHLRRLDDPGRMRAKPSGAMIQPLALGPGYLCFHPSFNGTNLFRHVAQNLGAGGADHTVPQALSGLVLHPFFERGGERAPVTDPRASGALLGLKGDTTPAQIAWAARESLAFIARMSHEMMRPGGEGSGAPLAEHLTEPLALGGGLAADRAFAEFLATVLGAEVEIRDAAHVGLRGLGALAATVLGHSTEGWQAGARRRIPPAGGALADYAARKYDCFRVLVDRLGDSWAELAELGKLATNLNGETE
ncbi:FGGY family carbohydrate kinase [Acidimangrovimonas sediminis]|uniref:FGGY family carbohydrate kinase n=1 Tax=Acidimangrovimonas sediminis TaxID=2056283 RepID=UPI000C800C12|nr:FGGY family carbohydrate kinase [Acidimangrovimonas sediminis]